MKTKRTEILMRGITLGAEFALIVVVLIFLGYFLGAKISESVAMIGMTIGAFLGLALATYQLIKRVG